MKLILKIDFNKESKVEVIKTILFIMDYRGIALEELKKEQ